MGMATTFAFSGMLINFIRDALTRKPPDPDDDLWKKVSAGLIQSQFLGPVTGMLWKQGPDPSSALAFAAGFAPKLKAVGDLIAIVHDELSKLVGTPTAWGHYGRLPVGKQLEMFERRQFGVARIALRWLDSRLYPNVELVSEVKGWVRTWDKDQQRQKGYVSTATGEPLNPDYWEIRQAVSNLDYPAARRLVAVFVKDKQREKQNLEEALGGLRASLMSSRPLNLSVENGRMFQFLNTLTADRRAKALSLNARYVGIVEALLD
jgi:hypothetical protein